MSLLLYALAGPGAFQVAQWLRERWRTRKDKGYNASRYRAF